MKKFLTAFIFLMFCVNAIANVAQPGIWNAGGMGNFSLLFPDDSLSYKKIQMADERVSIQLYNGYAVIKGVYKMYNDTKDTIKIKTGYPLNGNFNSNTNGNHKAEIRFDSLYGLDVKINSIPAKIISEPTSANDISSKNDNWYVWQNVFAPGDTTVITVYFIVSTNNSSVRKGYSKDKFNGFIYVLETGATWKQPIITGEIRIKPEDGITLKDIKGIKPESVFKTDEKRNLLQYKFSNLTPSDSDNIILTYSEVTEDFNFPKVLSHKNKLYKSIDEFSEMEINPEILIQKNFDSPFEVRATDWTSMVFILAFIGLPVLIIIIIILIIIFIVIRIRKNKKKKLN